MSCCTDAPYSSTAMESSATYKLVELDVDVIETISVSLIYSDDFHCFVDKDFVKTAHLTIFKSDKIKVTLVNGSFFMSTCFFLVPTGFGKEILQIIECHIAKSLPRALVSSI